MEMDCYASSEVRNLKCYAKINWLAKQIANVNSRHSVQMCATATFKRGYKENQWDCSDCVDFKIGGVNYVSIQALIDMVTAL